MPTHHGSEFAEAHRLYSGLRDIAYRHALARCIDQGLADSLTKITPITREALAAYSATWAGRRHWTGEGGWPWHLIAERSSKRPRSFHVAVWSGANLCGLALGSVSKGRRQITMRFMECSPDRHHPLRQRVALIVFEAATAYGEVVGAERILLRNPLPAVQPLYMRHGFTLAFKRAQIVYFERPLTQASEGSCD